ncbi:MAG: chloramphenicol phosphotransferase [Actinomycetota bacterium]|nr:chloramphenicol phosphotransferase [Actinomycetota bacterium]
MVDPGYIVVLNGAPRSGKSSIVAAIQDEFADPWMNLGVDVFAEWVTPPRYRPGIGLRPGGERPDLEAWVPVLFAAMYASVAAHSRLGLNVVVDVGHHDDYATPRGILPRVAAQLYDLPAFLVGVRCPLTVVMQRRAVEEPGREGRYARRGPGGAIPEAVRRWQIETHRPGIYDLEVDTSVESPSECAARIRARVESGVAPAAFRRLAATSAPVEEASPARSFRPQRPDV